jgi:hypothetical protein
MNKLKEAQKLITEFMQERPEDILIVTITFTAAGWVKFMDRMGRDIVSIEIGKPDA